MKKGKEYIKSHKEGKFWVWGFFSTKLTEVTNFKKPNHKLYLVILTNNFFEV